MKTREQVEELKRQWRSGGYWDIWETEGFEEYKDELKKYQEDFEKAAKEGERVRAENKAYELGISLELLRYIEHLEYQVERLSTRLTNLENPGEGS